MHFPAATDAVPSWPHVIRVPEGSKKPYMAMYNDTPAMLEDYNVRHGPIEPYCYDIDCVEEEHRNRVDKGERGYREVYWTEGDDLLFDDMFEHMVVNPSNEGRIIIFAELNRHDCPRVMNFIGHILTFWIIPNFLERVRNHIFRVDDYDYDGWKTKFDEEKRRQAAEEQEEEEQEQEQEHDSNFDTYDTVTAVVECDTTRGSFTIDVRGQWAPLGAPRFLELIEMDMFTDLPFFRVAPEYITQFGPKYNSQVQRTTSYLGLGPSHPSYIALTPIKRPSNTHS
jgi:hypothetical protein